MHKNDAITIMKRGKKKKKHYQDLYVAKGSKVSSQTTSSSPLVICAPEWCQEALLETGAPVG